MAFGGLGGLAALQRGRLQQLQIKQSLDNEQIGSNESAAGRSQQRGGDWGPQSGEGVHDQGQEHVLEAQWPPRRFLHRAMLLQQLRPTAMSLLQRRSAVGTGATLAEDSGSAANGGPAANGRQAQQQQQDSCQRGRQRLQEASMLPHGRLAARVGALRDAEAAEQAERAASADALIASTEAKLKRLLDNLDTQLTSEDLSGLLGDEELDYLVDRDEAQWDTWRAEVFQPPQTLLESFPGLASDSRAVQRVAQRLRLQYGGAVEEADGAKDQRALHVMMAWVHGGSRQDTTEDLEDMFLLQLAIGEVATQEASRSTQPLSRVIAVMLDTHHTAQQVEGRLKQLDPRLPQPGPHAGDWPLLLQGLARGDEDWTQVADRAVSGLGLLTSIASYSPQEVASEPMSSMAAAALLNLLQLLLDLGPYDGDAPLPLPIGFLFNALKLPPCMLLWAEDVMHFRLMVDDLCQKDSQRNSNMPLPYEDLRRKLQEQYLSDQPDGDWPSAPARYSLDHVSLVALLASDAPRVVAAMVFAMDHAARLPSGVEDRGLLRALLAGGHVPQLVYAVGRGFQLRPRVQGGWAQLMAARRRRQQPWGHGLPEQLQGPLAVRRERMEASSNDWTDEDEELYGCEDRPWGLGAGLKGLEDGGDLAEEEMEEEEVYYTRPRGGKALAVREQQLRYGGRWLDSGQETERLGTEEGCGSEREDGGNEEDGDTLRQLRGAMDALSDAVQEERLSGSLRCAMELVMDVLVTAAKLGLYDTDLQEGGCGERDTLEATASCSGGGGGGGVQGPAPSVRLAVAKAVRSEVEAAASRVSEQLSPLMPMARLLAKVWEVYDEGRQWIEENLENWEAPAVGAARRMMRLQLGLVGIRRDIGQEDCYLLMEELRPGLLEDPVVGHVWRRAVVELPKHRDGFDLLSQAVTGLAAVAGLPLDGLHVHLVPCAVVGALYNGRQQMRHRQVIPRDPTDALEVYRCLLYTTVLPPELDLARPAAAPTAPPDAHPPLCSPARADRAPAPAPAPALAAAPLATAVAHLPGQHRAAYGLLNQLCCFLSDPDGAAAEALCLHQALLHGQAEPAGTAAQQEPQEDPRAACGAPQIRVLCAAKLLATRDARQGLLLPDFLAAQEIPSMRRGCALGARAGGNSSVAAPPAPGLLPPGTQALCGGMDTERLVWALLEIRVMLSHQLARKTQQQGEAGLGAAEEEHGAQASAPRLVAWEPELLTLAAFTLHQDFQLNKEYRTALQPHVDVHLANMLLAGDTLVTEEACYNPPPGTPALVVLDLHPHGVGGGYSDETKAIMQCHMLDGVTDKTPRFSDALKRLRAALVDKSRVSATWVIAHGVGGLQRALLLAAKVRQELLADGRDLLVKVLHAGERARNMDAAELRQREQQQQEQEEGRGLQQRADAGGRSGRGSGEAGDAGGWLSGPWLSRELTEARFDLSVRLALLDELRLDGEVQLTRDGRVECLTDEEGPSLLAQAKDCVETLLHMFSTEGCVARSHVRVELLLEVVEKGSVGQQEGAGVGAGVKKAVGKGGQVVVRGAGSRPGKGARGEVIAKGRKQATEELHKAMFR